MAPFTVNLTDPVYVGMAVCAHDANGLTTAAFTNVSAEPLPQGRGPQQNYRSKISIYDMRDKSLRTLYQADTVFEAPNWSHDGKYLIANSGGKLYRIPVDGTNVTPEPIGIDPSLRLNNDHAPSWDGKYIAFSASSPSSRGSQVYVCNADGSNAHVMVSTTPSYFHGWSPDGKYLSYVYQHPAANGVPANYDIFRIPAAGGESEQLDSNPGYDDGPDYSPDGKWIYFNSDRSGSWDIWRIPADGAGPGDRKAEQVTSDELEDWFPHPSPDSKWLLFLSFAKGTANAQRQTAGHPASHDADARSPAHEAAADSGGDNILRRPGHDQRELLVARFHALRVRDLRAAAADGGGAVASPSTGSRTRCDEYAAGSDGRGRAHESCRGMSDYDRRAWYSLSIHCRAAQTETDDRRQDLPHEAAADSGGDNILRRPGHDQRELLVARFHALRVRDLRAVAADGGRAVASPSTGSRTRFDE